MILFFDTETTGKVDFRAQPDAAQQPRLVQFGAMLVDDDSREIATANLIIKPSGFTIPEEASKVHGITTERAELVGVDCSVARHIFRSWWHCASIVVGHNIDFDLMVMDGELYRAAGGPKKWGESRDTFCTMRAMTPICRLPGNYGDYKWPKLSEAYSHCFGEELTGAHDAMTDVRACAKVYQWIRARDGRSMEKP